MRSVAVLAAVLALALAGCAADEATNQAFTAAARAEIARHPADFQNGDSRAYLVRLNGQPRGLIWGTLHVAYTADTVLPRPIRDRFAEAADLTEETVLDRLPSTWLPAARARLIAANTQPDAAALARLDPQTRQAMADAGISADDLRTLSLRGLAGMAGRYAAGPPGALPQTGFVDLNLIGFARSMGKPVHGLEQPVDTDPTLADPNGADAAAVLRLTLRRRATAAAWAAWIRTVYGRGEVALLAGGLTGWQAAPEDLARTDRLRPATLTRRNAAWLPKLDRLFTSPGQHFVAVGAAHLLGADGLVALLRGQGWEVVPCPDDRCP